MWDDSGGGGIRTEERTKTRISLPPRPLDSAMIKPKYHFDRRLCLCLGGPPKSLSAPPSSSLSKIRSAPPLLPKSDRLGILIRRDLTAAPSDE